MSLTVLTPARTTALTLVSTLRDSMGVDASQDTHLERAIADATASIVRHCGRSFARAQYLETVAGFGGLMLMLKQTPVATVELILYDQDITPIVDFNIDNPHAGMLYRRVGWGPTATPEWFLTTAYPPDNEAKDYAVTYWAGFLLPGDDLHATTLSVLAGDQSFNDSAGQFPLLVPGDWFETRRFTGSNNGKFQVVARTASKITVAAGSGLLDEAADPDAQRDLLVRTLPDDVEQACIELARGTYYARTDDPNIQSQSIGSLSVSYRSGGSDSLQLVPGALTRLRRWRRVK